MHPPEVQRLAARIGLGFLVTALSIGAASAPVLAHNYPDPGSHRWQLYKQETVRYFVPDGAASVSSTEKVVRFSISSSTPEETPRASVEDKRSGRQSISKRTEIRKGDKIPQNRIEGRIQIFFTRQRVDSVLVTRTEIPYDVFEVTSWKVRDNQIRDNVYQVTDTVTWQDAVTGETLSQAAQPVEQVRTEPFNTPWVDRSSERKVRSGIDASETEVATQLPDQIEEIGRRSLASFKAAQASSGVGAVFGGDRSRGVGNASSASGAQARTALGARRVMSTGSSGSSRLTGQAAGQAIQTALQGSQPIKLEADGFKELKLQLASDSTYAVKHGTNTYPVVSVDQSEGRIRSVTFKTPSGNLVTAKVGD